MNQQPDTYNIIEIKCMDSDAIRLFVDKAEYEKQAARITELEATLLVIGIYANARSTGPAVEDALWGVRAMAYAALKGEQ